METHSRESPDNEAIPALVPIASLSMQNRLISVPAAIGFVALNCCLALIIQLFPQAIFVNTANAQVSVPQSFISQAMKDPAVAVKSKNNEKIEHVREAVKQKPKDPQAWLALAQVLEDPPHYAEALKALDRVIALDPQIVEAYDLKAERLATMGRFDDAEAAAKPKIFTKAVPVVLRGRVAWITAKRGDLAKAVVQMREVLRKDSDYYWGWKQLATWYEELGQARKYLETTERLTELRPDSASALAMRGDAKLSTGDREGGKRDLQKALKIDPDYSFSGALLFDTHLEDGEYDKARLVLEILEEHVVESNPSFVAARRTQLAVREDDPDAAMVALRVVCTHLCDTTWPINTAVDDCRGAGWDVDAVLRDVLENAPEFHPHSLFAWLASPDGQNADLELRLKLIDRAIKVHPDDTRSHDTKVETLTQAKRYEEALAACKPVFFGDHPPLILRGRAAWVIAQRGDRNAAIARMREILRKEPDYFWGWQHIANWYDANDAHADYLKASENLVRLSPKDPSAFGYRGEAKLLLGDRVGAKGDFQKAFDLDPKYAFAGLHLADEQLADNELTAAAQTIARLEEHVGGPYIGLRAIRLAVRKTNQAKARKRFRQMCFEPEATYLLLNKAANAMAEAGWSAGVEEVLSEVVKDKAAVSFVDKLWRERCAMKKSPKD